MNESRHQIQSDQKGSVTRGDVQKGLLSLRIFKVTAKDGAIAERYLNPTLYSLNPEP